MCWILFSKHEFAEPANFQRYDFQFVLSAHVKLSAWIFKIYLSQTHPSIRHFEASDEDFEAATADSSTWGFWWNLLSSKDTILDPVLFWKKNTFNKSTQYPIVDPNPWFRNISLILQFWCVLWWHCSSEFIDEMLQWESTWLDCGSVLKEISFPNDRPTSTKNGHKKNHDRPLLSSFPMPLLSSPGDCEHSGTGPSIDPR